MARFELRLVLPDRPGALGAVASALGAAGANIVSFDVVESGEDVAIDQLLVEAEPGAEGRLRDVLTALDDVTVETARAVPRRPSFASPLDLVEELLTVPADHVLQAFVDRVPMALRATWAVVLRARAPQPETLAASVGTPSLVGAATPWLPASRAVALAPAGWAPERWGLPDDTAAVAIAPVGAPDVAVLTVRRSGPAFRTSEVRQLGTLARVAGRLAATADDRPLTTAEG